MSDTVPVRRRERRGARVRILDAAADLFTRQGINATGVDQIASEAKTSKRTLYTHFGSKDALVSAYLEGITVLPNTPNALLARTGVPARERLLSIFDPITFGAPPDGHVRPGGQPPLRGCAFLNVAIELANPDHPAHAMATQYKRDFAQRLATVAREAGASDPELIGEQFALLWDGAAARSNVLNSESTGRVARGIATALLEAATAVGPAGPTGPPHGTSTTFP